MTRPSSSIFGRCNTLNEMFRVFASFVFSYPFFSCWGICLYHECCNGLI
uniref:Uncharacterized protein n=1 Tax=Setaria italica TaxID=4555 RepID=K3Y3V5_SETIT